MPCDRYISGMKLTLGRHDLAQDFYVMDLPDTNIILGVQWLSTLGPITKNYKTMEMSFTEETGKNVVLRGMAGNTPRVVTAKCMEAIFRREDIVYATKCKMSVRVDKKGETHYSLEIKKIMDSHSEVFEPIPPRASRVVTAKHMEAIFRREDIVYAAECKISVRVDKKGETHYSPKIKKIMDSHSKVFEPILETCPQGHTKWIEDFFHDSPSVYKATTRPNKQMHGEGQSPLH
jgi:hypothetical protein